jgi:hypothetical protein
MNAANNLYSKNAHLKPNLKVKFGKSHTFLQSTHTLECFQRDIKSDYILVKYEQK